MSDPLQKIQYILSLKAPDTLKYARIDKNIYVGGSLPALCQSRASVTQILNEIHDIDIYTKNFPSLSSGIERQDEFCQYIPNEFENFSDVLENYDCDMIAVGYHPFSNTMIITERFKKGCETKEFTWFPNVLQDYDNKKRLDKLVLRAKQYFDAKIVVVRQANRFSTAVYDKQFCVKSCSTYENYIHFFFGKYYCVVCKSINCNLLCEKCTYGGFKQEELGFKRAVIIGGVNGFGMYITKEFRDSGIVCSATSRSGKKASIPFDLNEEPSYDLIGEMLDADVIVFNANQTLEGDESIWLNTLETFNEDLAKDRFITNSLGYARLLKYYIKIRKQSRRKQVFVFVDANESFDFSKKLKDTRHIELNMAKAATKQVFVTNAPLFATLGIVTVAYNPGWMSYHGIDPAQKTELNSHLINPALSARGLLYAANSAFSNISKCIIDRLFMYDESIYDQLNNREVYEIFNDYQNATDDSDISSAFEDDPNFWSEIVDRTQQLKRD